MASGRQIYVSLVILFVALSPARADMRCSDVLLKSTNTVTGSQPEDLEHERILAEVEAKSLAGQQLTREELRFLYQIDERGIGLGNKEDPRISKIRASRNLKADLSFALGFGVNEISLTLEEGFSAGIKYHYGDLSLNYIDSLRGEILPQTVSGNLFLESLTSAKGLMLPEVVGGHLVLSSLSAAEGVVLPKYVGGGLILWSLTSADRLVLPEYVGNVLDLRALVTAKDLVLPEHVGDELDLRRLTSADRIAMPESVGSHLNLKSLVSADGIVLPNYVGGDLNLQSLTSLEGVTLPKRLGGRMYLRYFSISLP